MGKLVKNKDGTYTIKGGFNTENKEDCQEATKAHPFYNSVKKPKKSVKKSKKKTKKKK